MKKHYFLLIVSVLTLSVFFACSDSDDDYVPINNLPVATDDTVESTLTEPITITVLANDTTGSTVVASTVSIKGGSDTDSNGTLDILVVPNQGTWTVAATGTITFTPLPTFTGNPTQISYTVKDAQNNVSNEALVTINAVPIVSADLTQVPYPKLSDYHFFIGEMKNQIPSLNVLPYAPASSLFTDYAHKKRFVWMPTGLKGTYVSDSKVFELPVGSALIKTFYYDNVQPANTTRIIETRVMIRKADGWIFADYVWNDAQTEAYFDLNGSYTAISWKDENDVIKSANYRIPSQVQCLICHKQKEMSGPTEITTQIPIGIKPQNLNFDYNYGTETKNQLTKWIEQGYLENNFSFPTPENTTVNYNDTSKSLELRARSYLDINCAHCHQLERHCDYRPMRFDFKDTGDATNGLTNLGVCVNTSDMQDFDPALDKVVNPENPARSMLYHRINTDNESYRMPLHGRTIIHVEGVALIEQWINSLHPCE
ncbi:Ig-like domain-containing protein [Flavobacterium phycosphaerae]|uniref:Ig-like domain-containing protein n=1 Tax=Flavobacterium phycosphaerae TaxID=2697515 RepID=UPI00138A0EAE|nr:Ig-like domain-containing protein [Flavobacterium phycosphaerae]